MIIKELKRRTTLLATFASLFYNVGQLKKSEEVYVVYVQMVEQNYGLQSLETSNCYYLVGVFYLENSYLKKAMACLKRALDIRIQHLGPKHAAVADCYYNIGLIFYVIGDRPKATSWILNALTVRLADTGEESLYVAKIYEMLAQIAIDERDLKGGFDKLQKSLQIKSGLFTDPSHPEIQKTLSQLQDLAAKIGIDSSVISPPTRTRHASAGPALQGLTQNRTVATDNQSEESNPFSALLNMFDQKPPERADSRAQFERLDTRKNLPADNLAGMPQLGGGKQKSSESPEREVTFAENTELLMKFFKPGGNKIITEEDSDDDDLINEQLAANQHKGQSSEDDDSGSDIEKKTTIETDAELMAKLSQNQKSQLLKLKDDIYQKGALESGYRPIGDVVNSLFFNSLSPKSRDHFRRLNLHIFNE